MCRSGTAVALLPADGLSTPLGRRGGSSIILCSLGTGCNQLLSVECPVLSGSSTWWCVAVQSPLALCHCPVWELWWQFVRFSVRYCAPTRVPPYACYAPQYLFTVSLGRGHQAPVLHSCTCTPVLGLPRGMLLGPDEQPVLLYPPLMASHCSSG